MIYFCITLVVQNILIMDLKTYSEQKLTAFNQPTGKVVKCNPLKAQLEIFDALTNNTDVQIVQSRNMGVSTALATYIAHHLEHGTDDSPIYIVVDRLELGQHVISTVKRIINGIEGESWGNQSSIEMNNKKVEIILGGINYSTIEQLVTRGIVILMHPEWYKNSDALFNGLSFLKQYQGEKLKLIVNGKIPINCSINFKTVKIHWADSELWTRERYIEVMRYMTTDEMDDLNPYIKLDKSSKVSENVTMDKTIQVRVDKQVYNKLALSAANSDKSISEYVRKIINENIAN